MQDKRYVWRLKKALNRLGGGQQAVLSSTCSDFCVIWVRELLLAAEPAEEPDHRGPDGQWSARGGGEALRGAGNAHCHEAGAAVALLGGVGSTWARDSGAPNPGS